MPGVRPLPSSRTFDHGNPRRICWILLASFLCAIAHGETKSSPVKGLPFTRFYTFDEIGHISRGARLSFDKWGRIVAVQNGTYHTLNDDVWLNAETRSPESDDIHCVTKDVDGTMYYGALGSWGIIESVENGQLVTQRLAPHSPPEWVLTSNFNDVLCRPEGIYFAGTNALVFRDRATKQFEIIEMPNLSGIFTIGGRVFVSSHSKGVFQFDPHQKKLVIPETPALCQNVISHAAELPDGRALLSTTGRALLRYRGDQVTRAPGIFKDRLEGSITALQPLLDGNVAVAVANMGLFIVTAEGEIVTSLTDLNYRNISSLATAEPGVLWAATETSIVKILYSSPVTRFGQALGLYINWPQMLYWEDQLIVASAGRLYESIPSAPGEPTRFQSVARQPYNGVWGLATYQHSLVVCNSSGVFSREPGQPFKTVIEGIDAGRLVMLDSGVCLVIGAKEITALARENNRWVECAARIPGIGYPSVVHQAPESVWIEVGANRAGRLTFREGKLQTRVFDSYPWPDPRWVNISVIGNTVILAGEKPWRLFFDDKTETFLTSCPIKDILEQAPTWVSRIQSDDTGRLWASYEHGILTLTPKDGKYEVDTATYAFVNERSALIRTQPGPDVWITNGSSLYHVDGTQRPSPNPTFRPTLVSMRDRKSNKELPFADPTTPVPMRIDYDQNDLTFRFFAGSYSSRQTPTYEYRVNHNSWSTLESNSVLTLSDLREGNYSIDVRLTEDRGQIGPMSSLEFTIAPPWFRTWLAYTVYGAAIGFSIFILIRVSIRRTKTRNIILEKMVAERTDALELAMKKLQQETQTAATLAERNRLAGEIHDSLEQGFSGLIFQLETTAGLTECPREVQGGLSVARNMVAFCRNEIRHALWDLHSPLLDSGGLQTALNAAVAQLAPASSHVSIVVEGTSRPLGSTFEHHLLRIAQEAVVNAIKHANATEIEVKLIYREELVELSVRDNGRGFDPKNVLVESTGHFGLRSLRGRANKIGGTITITSRPGSGTCVTARLVTEAKISEQNATAGA